MVADPELIPCAIDETLRYDPPVPVWRRATKRPVKLGDVDLPEGAKLFLWLAASGRDAPSFRNLQPSTFTARKHPSLSLLASAFIIAWAPRWVSWRRDSCSKP